MHIPYKNVDRSNIADCFENWRGHQCPDTGFVVLYHSQCNDGLVSASVVANFINTNYKADNAIYVPVAYGKDVFSKTFKENQDVVDFIKKHPFISLIVVDFSFPVQDVLKGHTFPFLDERMGKLSEIFDSVLILDHHISSAVNYRTHYELAQTDADSLFVEENCYFLFTEANDMSGATMTWNFFFNGQPETLLVKVAEDRDLWKKQMKLTEQGDFLIKSLNFGITGTPASKNPFAQYLDENDEAIEKAEKLTQLLLSDETFEKEADRFTEVVKYYKANVKSLSKRYFIKDLCNHERCDIQTKHRVAFVDCPSMYASDVCAAIYNEHDVDYVVSFSIIEKDGQCMANLSMRSKKDGGADVSEICGYFGGGGHANAAGCTMTLMDFVAYFGFCGHTEEESPYINQLDFEKFEAAVMTGFAKSNRFFVTLFLTAVAVISIAAWVSSRLPAH